MKQNNIRVTDHRLDDFRTTMGEIIDLKNGIKPLDFKEEILTNCNLI